MAEESYIDKIQQARDSARPRWMDDPAGMMGEPVSVPMPADAGDGFAPSVQTAISDADWKARRNRDAPISNQPKSFVGNLGTGEIIGKPGGPDILLKSLTSADSSVTIETSDDRNEIDFVVNFPDQLEITSEDGSITVAPGANTVDLSVNFPDVSGLPDGNQGDMLYWDVDTETMVGSWILLVAPAAPASNYDDPVLRHDGTKPYWDTPSVCAGESP